jgi:NAD(P)-dependent dehydrogenase (short-subunit alcohol dehydrogenase family)
MGILKGQVAIVTGASRGIGKAIAMEYASEGAHVAVASRTSSTVEAVVASIEEAGGSAMGVTCDVGDRDAIYAMVERTIERFGGVDILVNNAQSFGTRKEPSASAPVGLMEDLSEEEFDWTFETGAKATLRAMQAVFPSMKERGGGRIINFGSRRGILSHPESAAYNATKEAIRSLTRTAAVAWGQYGIRANVINPVIETDAARSDFELHPGLKEKARKQIPLRYWGQPRDCARIAVFLAGPDSAYLTGMTFFAEGGATTLP